MATEDPTTEEWRPIPSLNGRYAASSLGRIRRETAGIHTRPGRILNPPTARTGYPMFGASMGSRRHVTQRTVHSVVAEAFLGPCPPGHEVNHKDSDKTNGRPENLEYVTRRRNMQHAVAAGVRHAKRLTPQQVEEIRSRFPKESAAVLAAHYGVAWITINRIVKHRTWKPQGHEYTVLP